jgi:MinD-like ATPase involved in chromosome partitioning or flagellar assembly
MTNNQSRPTPPWVTASDVVSGEPGRSAAPPARPEQHAPEPRKPSATAERSTARPPTPATPMDDKAGRDVDAEVTSRIPANRVDAAAREGRNRGPLVVAPLDGSPERRWPNPNHPHRPPADPPSTPRTEPPPPARPATDEPRHGREIGREVLFRPAKRPPQSGWRRFVHRLTGGSVNPGESVQDIRHRELVERVNVPIRGDYKIGVLSLKGGVGKTTTTVGLGSTFAALRGDHVVAVDANPDRGTLAERIPTETAATVRDLLDDASNIRRYSDVRAFTSQAPSRLEVLASERDPRKAEAFSEGDYRGAMAVLEGFYNLLLTDCGTGLTHSAMRGVLDTADALVLVSSPALDGARSADATLSWLEAQGYGHLVERTVVVISSAGAGSATVNLAQLVDHFDARVRAVKVIPFDPHLAEGSEVDLDRLSTGTREAFTELAALVAEDFPVAAGRHHGPVWRGTR